MLERIVISHKEDGADVVFLFSIDLDKGCAVLVGNEKRVVQTNGNIPNS